MIDTVQEKAHPAQDGLFFKHPKTGEKKTPSFGVLCCNEA
jgi:hypothetical protein